jgi:hypothetical protein
MGNQSKAVGMPFAWHHTNDSSPDSPYCFIGFYKASMPLTQEATNDTDIYRDFVTRFYWYALAFEYSVMDALDKASEYLYQSSYVETELHGGFNATWNNVTDYGEMRIYGNNSTHLNQHDFTVLAKDQNNTYHVNKDVYIDIMHNLANTNSTIKVNEGKHTIFANEFWVGTTGNRSFFQNYTYGNVTDSQQEATWNFTEDRTATAHFKLRHCPGDATGNGIVDTQDIVFVNLAFGAYRGDPKWDSRADLDCSGLVDIVDSVTVAINFGNKYW